MLAAVRRHLRTRHHHRPTAHKRGVKSCHAGTREERARIPGAWLESRPGGLRRRPWRTLKVRTMLGWLMADMRMASICAMRSLRASHSCSSGASALVLPAMICSMRAAGATREHLDPPHHPQTVSLYIPRWLGHHTVVPEGYVMPWSSTTTPAGVLFLSFPVHPFLPCTPPLPAWRSVEAPRDSQQRPVAP